MVVPLLGAVAVTGAVVGCALKSGSAPDADAEAKTETGAGSDTDGEDDHKKDRNNAETVDESDTDASNQLRFAGGSAILIGGSRQAGIDRHAEAALAEELHAKEYARNVGGTVIEDNCSVFTPDGGVDKTVRVGADEVKIQSKHHAKELPESVLQEYTDNVDVLATSNGTSPNVDASDYDIEIFTPEDWSTRSKVRLEIRRVVKGIEKGKSGVRTSLGKIAKACRKLSTNIISFLGWLSNATAGTARAAVGWVLGLTTLQQVSLAAGVVAVAALVWRRVASDSDFNIHLPRVIPT